jgi:signal transduction histidine kinase
VIDSVGLESGCSHFHTLTVGEPPSVLGEVDVCTDTLIPHARPWQLPLAIFLVAGVLWAIAGTIARRISWPLSELTRVARQIGEGDLAARPRFCIPRDRGEIGELAFAINVMAGRIERQLKDQRELLAAVSHELRTPLTRIRLLLELARDGGAKGKDPLGEIDGEVVEIDALVADLLASARMDFGALTTRKLDAIKVARDVASRSDVPSARVDIEGRPGELEADPTLLARAIGNLLDNARKYGGPKVVLRVRDIPDFGVAFEVDDDGKGFPPGDETRAFEPFYRGRNGTEQRGGVGLGLALVRRIAEAHGGRVYAKNLASGGARVAVELPRTPVTRPERTSLTSDAV